MKEHIYQQGDIIFRQGDESSTMFEILSGKVSVYADYQTEHEKKLATFEEMHTFGEMGMIENLPRSATAVAEEDQTTVREINGEEFADYFKEKPIQVFLLMKQMSRRLRDTTQNYVEACRTVAETMETEQKGEEKSGWLNERLKAFADVYRKLLGEAE